MTNARPTYIPKSLLSRLDRPLLIWLAPTLLLIDALLATGFASLVVISDNVHVSVGHDPRSEVSNLWIIVLCSLNVLVNFYSLVGFVREKTWARPLLSFGHAGLLVTLYVVGVSAGANPFLAVYNVMPLLAAVVFQFWYLYRRDSVIQYYGRLRS